MTLAVFSEDRSGARHVLERQTGLVDGVGGDVRGGVGNGIRVDRTLRGRVGEQVAAMKKVFLTWTAFLSLAPLAVAHVGSPNVFFDGPAGSYFVYAVIRPPAALPGAAQVSLQLREP